MAQNFMVIYLNSRGRYGNARCCIFADHNFSCGKVRTFVIGAAKTLEASEKNIPENDTINLVFIQSF